MNEVELEQQALIEEFELFHSWTDRYQYIVDLGRKLPDFPLDKKIESNRIKGCQSQVWFLCDRKEGRLFFSATSDAAIVLGLIAILLRVYNGKLAKDILEASDTLMTSLSLDQHLSPTRSNGLSSMLAVIRQFAGEE